MTRKAAKPQQPRAQAPAAESPDAGSEGVVPMELQVGDRFTDHGFEWEVLTHPTAMHGARTLRARITRPGLPETEREVTWQAHERSVIRRLHDTDDGGLSGHVKPGKNREAADRLAALTSPSDAEANAEVARK